MKLFKKHLLFLIPFFLLISCTTKLERLSRVEGSLRTERKYDSYLALEYLEYSRNLASVKDKKKSEYFAKKGLDLIDRKIIVPENPINWEADPAQVEEMVLMQDRLETILNTSNLKFYLPIQLAHLTYLYDCWISRESKAVFRADELAQCRVRFYKLAEEIEHYLVDLKKDQQPKVKIIEPEFERFEILFDFNSSKFNDKANADLIKILNYLKTIQVGYRILLVGNADRSGHELYNRDLASYRAEVVKYYLSKNGVAKESIETRSAGEDFPDILTKDGVHQQSNRTVGIYVMKGLRDFSDYPLPLIENYVYRDEIKKARKERGLE